MKTGKNRWDQLLINARLCHARADARGYDILEDAAIGIAGHQIVFADHADALPTAITDCADAVTDLAGALVTPGLIDCHTHLVFAGDRADEFEMRLQGASYEEVAAAGGGIVSSVRATRAAGFDGLLAQSLKRARQLLADGVTTIEIKSGYALNLEGEQQMLEVARAIGEQLGVTVSTSFLGLHAIPPEYKDRRDDYVNEVIDHWLPKLHQAGLVDAVDGFCEGIGFNPAEIRRLFEKAKSLGVPVRLHADQLSDLGGAALSAEFNGWSADHIEYSSESAIKAMADSGTVAVLLPGAFYCLREKQLPPIAALRREGVAIAVATDLNPGTSPLCSLRLAMNQACTLFRLTPAECLAGVTHHAAKAIGMSHRKGRIACGMDADIAVWSIQSPAELCYWMGASGPAQIWSMGRQLNISAG